MPHRLSRQASEYTHAHCFVFTLLLTMFNSRLAQDHDAFPLSELFRRIRGGKQIGQIKHFLASFTNEPAGYCLFDYSCTEDGKNVWQCFLHGLKKSAALALREGTDILLFRQRFAPLKSRNEAAGARYSLYDLPLRLE